MTSEHSSESEIILCRYFQKDFKMTSRNSPIWKYFIDDPEDQSNALCQVFGCKAKVSRGKKGSNRGSLLLSCLDSHLKNRHPKAYEEYKEDKANQIKNAAEKRKAEDDGEEMESQSVSKIRNETERNSFMKSQATLRGWLGGSVTSSFQPTGSTYNFNDQRAKERHRLVFHNHKSNLVIGHIKNDRK